MDRGVLNELSGDELALAELGENLVQALADRVLGGLKSEFSLGGAFERPVHSSHAFHEASGGFCVEAFDISPLAFSEGAVDTDDEQTVLRNDGGDDVAEVAGGGNERNDDGEAGLHGELSYVSSAADVFGAILRRKTQVRAHARAEHITIETKVGVLVLSAPSDGGLGHGGLA